MVYQKEITPPDLLAFKKNRESWSIGYFRTSPSTVLYSSMPSLQGMQLTIPADLVDALKSPQKKNYNFLKREDMPGLVTAVES